MADQPPGTQTLGGLPYDYQNEPQALGSPIVPAPAGVMGWLMDALGAAAPEDAGGGALQAMTAWKRKGWSPAMMKTIQQLSSRMQGPQKQKVNKPINDRNTAYYPLNEMELEHALRDGALGNWPGNESGMSVSRVPGNPNSSMTAELDRSLMPNLTPHVWPGGYGKTQTWKPGSMNPDFEFTDRLEPGQTIPLSAIKRILVDGTHYRGSRRKRLGVQNGTVERLADPNGVEMVGRTPSGIPIQVVPSTKGIKSIRASNPTAPPTRE